ncbi:MAG TPA: hypothetical protein VFF78_00875 [Anaerolineaceae bacterium]|nr:hypothetical protein [Anaerolineaceae bacterium]
MKTRFLLNRKVRFGVLAVLLTLVVLATLVGTALGKPAENTTLSLEDKGGPGPTLSFSYQGKLYDGGLPANGTYDFVVDIYSASAGGTYIGNCINTNGVLLDDYQVTDGLFNFTLACGTFSDNHGVFTGTARYVQVQVRPGTSIGVYTTLPRQAISPAPYAWGFLPGTMVIGAAWNDGTLEGDALLSLNNTNTVGSALWIQSGGDYGLYSNANGSGDSYAVQGLRSGSGMGIAVKGLNTAVTGSGVGGTSTNYLGVWGDVGRADHNYGFYTPDNLYSQNYHTKGAIMQIVQNGGSQPLERGDVVVIAGMGDPLTQDGIPVIRVAKADGAASTAVIGVVAEGYSDEWFKAAESAGASGAIIPPSTTGPIAPGELLLVVVQGPCQVKASALGGAIQPGDLLATASAAGKASAAKTATVEGVSFALPGTVFAKALEPLAAGKDGLIYVFVTLQ